MRLGFAPPRRAPSQTRDKQNHLGIYGRGGEKPKRILDAFGPILLAPAGRLAGASVSEHSVGFRRKLGWPDILLVGLLWRILESAPYISV